MRYEDLHHKVKGATSLINSIQEAETILRGKVSGVKKRMIEASLARTKKKLADLVQNS